MNRFVVNNVPTKEVELWCWNNIGPGGSPLRKVVGSRGSQEYEDPWEGDLWQRIPTTSIFIIKEDRHAFWFKLRWE